MTRNKSGQIHIVNISVYRKQLALKQSYMLSFGTLRHFDTFIVHVLLSNDSEGFGESVPLPGYGWEDSDSVAEFLAQKKKEYDGKPVVHISADLDEEISANPFAATAIYTALETASGGLPPRPVQFRTPAVGLLDHTGKSLSDAINSLRGAGFKTLKVKLGTQDFQKDMQLLKRLTKENLDNILLRFDANQAFAFEEALQIGRALEWLPVEFYEQPLPKNEWQAQKELAQRLNVKTMLDESIWSIADVRRAIKDKSADAIKLKLMKCGSFANVIKMSELAKKNGLDVVLGNGVAGPLNCWYEAVLHNHLGLATAGEMNGFNKLKDNFFAGLLQMHEGRITVTQNFVSGKDIGL